MRKISHRALVSGGVSAIGKLVSMNPATHTYAAAVPNASSWPRRGVVMDAPDEHGLQEVLISGSFTTSASASQWLTATAGGVIAGNDNPTEFVDVIGYVDTDSVGWIGKTDAGRDLVDEDQWERQTLTMLDPMVNTYLYWTIPPETTLYHVLLEPVSISQNYLVNLTPTYQTEGTLVPYLPVKYTTGTSYVQVINSNTRHPGTSIVYDVQLVR